MVIGTGLGNISKAFDTMSNFFEVIVLSLIAHTPESCQGTKSRQSSLAKYQIQWGGKYIIITCLSILDNESCNGALE